MFDLVPLSVLHSWLFGIGFVVVAAAMVLLTKETGWRLRKVPGRLIYYVGCIIVGVTAPVAAWLVDDYWRAVGIMVAAIAIFIVGARDEHRPIAPLWQLVSQLVIAAVLVGSGWSITQVTHPSGVGVIDLTEFAKGLFLFVGALLSLVWLVVIMNAVNWLDGADGLAGAVSLIALVTLAAISLLPQIQDSTTLGLAVIGAGAVLGFLLWNVPPARVYLGTIGSWWLGLYIALVAMAGGGKVATTLLVLALPLLDAASVVFQRALAGQSLWRGDSRHLHHRLLAAGYSPRQILVGASAITAVLGIAAVALQTYQKIAALGLAAGMVSLATLYLILRTANRDYS